MGADSDDFVQVFAGSPVKAGMLRSLLEAEGLLAFVRDENAATIWPSHLIGAGYGVARVVVPRDQADRAREILAIMGA